MGWIFWERLSRGLVPRVKSASVAMGEWCEEETRHLGSGVRSIQGREHIINMLEEEEGVVEEWVETVEDGNVDD